MTTFNPGDEVEWTSQSAGVTKTKRGRVHEVVPAGQRPIIRVKSFGSSRDHLSYTVRVNGGRLYWPLVKNLKPVKEG